ncbi:MAG: metal homeostatis BSD2 family protein [Treponema sp.]|nr:metal homeostatis BSD2 family protein [Treponema sp.]
MEILLIGALAVGLAIMIPGFISYWRDKQHEKKA